MRNPSTPDCGIRGCTRAAYKGRLCRGHYALVPPNQYMEAMVAVMTAAHKAAKQHHEKQFRYVRDLLKAS